MEITPIIEEAARLGASDVHLKPGRKPALRIDGEMRSLGSDTPPLSDEDLLRFLDHFLADPERRRLEESYELDLARDISVSKGLLRLRLNIHRQRTGWGIVIRILSDRIPGFDDLDLEPAVRELARLPRGLVLVTGPTGSGKSTTLASLMDSINQERSRHLYSIEDPIEYLYHARRSEVTQRELGSHTRSFAAALKSAMRGDPDVILVGEMRDLETIQLALTAAETGHLVFSTLHTCDSTQSIDRIIDVFPSAQQAMVRSQLANVLQAIVSQVLLPRAGDSGRVAAREILLANAAVRNLIRESKTHQLYSTLSSSVLTGMCPLELSLASLVRSRSVEKEDALEVANRPSVFLSYLESAQLPSRPNP